MLRRFSAQLLRPLRMLALEVLPRVLLFAFHRLLLSKMLPRLRLLLLCALALQLFYVRIALLLQRCDLLLMAALVLLELSLIRLAPRFLLLLRVLSIELL